MFNSSTPPCSSCPISRFSWCCLSLSWFRLLPPSPLSRPTPPSRPPLFPLCWLRSPFVSRAASLLFFAFLPLFGPVTFHLVFLFWLAPWFQVPILLGWGQAIGHPFALSILCLKPWQYRSCDLFYSVVFYRGHASMLSVIFIPRFVPLSLTHSDASGDILDLKIHF